MRVGQCELEPFCNVVLEKHWPKIWRHTNVKTLTGKLISDHCGRINALVGGPPCQPASVAGQRRGSADDRWLWPEYLRLVSEINDAQERPLLWLLAENPRGVLSLDVEGLQFSEWLAREFAARGYEILPVELAAEDVGAPHGRERVWFVAYSTSIGRREGRIYDANRPDARRQEAAGGFELCGEAMADAESADQSGLPIRTPAQIAQPRIIREYVADANSGRQHEPQGSHSEERRWAQDGGSEQLADADSDRFRHRANQSQRIAWRDGSSHSCADVARWPARPGEPQHEWEEPRVLFDRRTAFSVSILDADTGHRGGLAGVVGKVRSAFKSALGFAIDGISIGLARWRVAALKACGNAVVPQCAQVLGDMINRYQDLNGK